MSITCMCDFKLLKYEIAGKKKSASNYSSLGKCMWFHSYALIFLKCFNHLICFLKHHLVKVTSLTDSVQSVQSLSRVQLFASPWTAARQASLSITNSQSLPKPMSFESVMPSNHLILCRPLLLLPLIFPSIRVFSNESVLLIRWPKYWPKYPINRWDMLNWIVPV